VGQMCHGFTVLAKKRKNPTFGDETIRVAEHSLP